MRNDNLTPLPRHAAPLSIIRQSVQGTACHIFTTFFRPFRSIGAKDWVSRCSSVRVRQPNRGYKSCQEQQKHRQNIISAWNGDVIWSVSQLLTLTPRDMENGRTLCRNIILSKWENQYTTQRVLWFCFHRTDRQIDKAHFVSLVRAKTTIPCAHYDNPILSSPEEEEEEDWGFVRRWGGGSSSWYRLTENVERRPQRRWRRKSSYRNGK